MAEIVPGQEMAWLDWFGCATFRMRTYGGLTIWLDAYLDRVPSAEQSGFGVDDVTEADWILVGHSHFDHLYGAERIAVRTGAKVIGSYETARILAEAGVPEEQLVPVSGGERVKLNRLTAVRVFPSMHSCTWATDPMPASDQRCRLTREDDLAWHERQERLRDLWSRLDGLGDEVREHMALTDQGARGDGGPLIYIIDTMNGSVLFQDTAGCWTGLLEQESPTVAILAAAGRGQHDGDPVDGTLAEFVAEEAAILGCPERVLLCHHDDWLPGFSRRIDVEPIREALAHRAPRTELVEIGYRSNYPLLIAD
ncbi:MAG: MBL fold metallo-hydrolase [Pseudonocardia sp.]|nr:MBL fold metallo-hydrolase [Pseudonocardia sp.]